MVLLLGNDVRFKEMKTNKFLKKIAILTGLLTMSLNTYGYEHPNIAYAEIIEQTVDAVGEYRPGDNESRTQAKEGALADAKRIAAEKVMTSVESVTDVENFMVLKDKIRSYTKANMRILEQKYEFTENGTLCKAYVTATVRIDTNIMADPTPTSTPNPNPAQNTTAAPSQNTNNEIYRRPLGDREVRAEGEYQMGGHDTIEEAKKFALTNAMNNASMTAGVMIRNYTKVKDFIVTEDIIEAYSKNIVKLKEVKYSIDNFLCKAIIIAEVELDKIEEPSAFRQPLTPTPYTDTTISSKYEKFEDHVYLIVDGLNLDYRRAEDWCINHGGHLVYIESEKEQAFINNLLLTKCTKNCYWIGGQRGIDQKKWYWGNQRSQIMKYTNWANGQPDNYTKGENILMIYRIPNPKAMSATGQWNDIGTDGDCNGEDFFGVSNFGFICEWESQANVRN